MSNLSSSSADDQRATLMSAAHDALVAALRGCVLTVTQARALREILLQLHVVAELLDEADAPDAPRFMAGDAYRASLAATAITVFRRELAALVAADGPPEDDPFTAQMLAEVHHSAAQTR